MKKIIAINKIIKILDFKEQKIRNYSEFDAYGDICKIIEEYQQEKIDNLLLNKSKQKNIEIEELPFQYKVICFDCPINKPFKEPRMDLVNKDLSTMTYRYECPQCKREIFIQYKKSLKEIKRGIE